MEFEDGEKMEIYNLEYTLTLQKSRMPQIQGIKAVAVVVYRPATAGIIQEMRYHRLSWKVNKTT